MKIPKDTMLTKIIAEALSAYLYNRACDVEEAIDAECTRLRREEPKRVENFDHKDWKHANDHIRYLHGQHDELTYLLEELGRFMDRCGLS